MPRVKRRGGGNLETTNGLMLSTIHPATNILHNFEEGSFLVSTRTAGRTEFERVKAENDQLKKRLALLESSGDPDVSLSDDLEDTATPAPARAPKKARGNSKVDNGSKIQEPTTEVVVENV